MIKISFEDCCDLRAGSKIRVKILKGMENVDPDFVKDCESGVFKTLDPRHLFTDTIFFFESVNSGNEWCLVEETLEDNDDLFVEVLLITNDDETSIEPKNNDGRDTCYWCNSRTEKIDTGFSVYDYCKECKR